MHLSQGIIGECVWILVSNFSEVPVTCQHSKRPGSLLQVERVWGLARQPICVVSRDTGYLPKKLFWPQAPSEYISLNVPTVAVVDWTEKGGGACGVPVTTCLVFGVFNHEFPSEVLCPSPQARSRRQFAEKVLLSPNYLPFQHGELLCVRAMNLWSSNTGGCDVPDLLYSYLVSQALMV